MKILHVCWGTGTNNGAANIARLIMDEQRAAGDEPMLVRRPTWAQLKVADQVWCHCGWYWFIWLIAAYKRFFHDKTYLYWVPECCYDPMRLGYHGWKKALAGPIERWALRQADILVATCEAEVGWIRDYVRRKERVEHGERPKIVVSDIKRFFNLNKEDDDIRCRPRPPTSTLNILYLGRPHPLKGVTYLESAVAKMNGAVALRQASAATGDELERLWDWCDVLCLPTLSDNFGLVIAEALERGKRVLTTDGAPAWEPKDEGDAWRDRLFYLTGYRAGDENARVTLLTDALKQLVEVAGVEPASEMALTKHLRV